MVSLSPGSSSLAVWAVLSHGRGACPGCALLSLTSHSSS